MKVRKILQVPLFVAIVALGISSCKTPAELPKVEARPISTNKLLKKVEQNAFDFEYLTIKKINCNFSTSSSKASFKIELKAKKDKKILVSIKKLNIPVGRVLLTPESVKYVNYIDRNYFIDDYSFISDFLNMDFDFATVQSIISNNAFSYRNDPRDKDFKTFDSFIEKGLYVLQSEKARKLFKMEEKGKTNKIERRLKRLDDEALILQKMYFNPGNFNLTRLEINDKTYQRNMSLDFNNFVQLQENEFPSELEMKFTSEAEEVKMRIRMSGFSTNKIESFNIKIPEKYEQINVH